MAIEARSALLDEPHTGALRLFNGFLEGYPGLVIDLYARTAVLHNHAEPPELAEDILRTAHEQLLGKLPWIQSILRKDRFSGEDRARRGKVVWGERPDRRVSEHGVKYAVDLELNQDASLYLDTRNLRRWAIDHLKGKRVLNTFAYTGSLGVAALAGGAAQVIQLDRNRKSLNIAKESYTLNGFPIHKDEFLVGDFFPIVASLRRREERFDCVFLDPPFFSSGPKGDVDLYQGSERLINKIRPLIDNGGWLVAINNALFLEGQSYLRSLETLCADGYLTIEQLIAVPDDITGYPHTRVSAPPADPAPFNHATKIALLRVLRKMA